jgi:hypothetical protein
MDAAVGAHGEGRADGFLSSGRADRNATTSSQLQLLSGAALLDRNFIKRVHCHFHVGEFDTAIVGLDATLTL